MKRRDYLAKCDECGAMYDPDEVEHITVEGHPLEKCLVVPSPTPPEQRGLDKFD